MKPTLIIGIGTTGAQLIAAISARICITPFGNQWRFLSIDTDLSPDVPSFGNPSRMVWKDDKSSDFNTSRVFLTSSLPGGTATGSFDMPPNRTYIQQIASYEAKGIFLDEEIKRVESPFFRSVDNCLGIMKDECSPVFDRYVHRWPLCKMLQKKWIEVDNLLSAYHQASIEDNDDLPRLIKEKREDVANLLKKLMHVENSHKVDNALMKREKVHSSKPSSTSYPRPRYALNRLGYQKRKTKEKIGFHPVAYSSKADSALLNEKKRHTYRRILFPSSSVVSAVRPRSRFALNRLPKGNGKWKWRGAILDRRRAKKTLGRDIFLSSQDTLNFPSFHYLFMKKIRQSATLNYDGGVNYVELHQ